MSKKYFKELAGYHLWANNVVWGWLKQISDEQWKQNVVSSFTTIQDTILHIANAEKIWLQRLKKLPQNPITVKTKNDLINIWKETSTDLKNFIEQMPEEMFEEKLQYKNTKGVEFHSPYYELIAHVVNHSTYHRGQVVTMLRQVGFTGVSSTDMTTWFRNNNK
jgi:uncharacterized damage-inducible protein DinB